MALSCFMSAFLHNIQTVTPEQCYQQSVVAETMKAGLGGERRSGRLIERIYKHSGINTRYSVVKDLVEPEEALFFTDEGMMSPSTATRNALYTQEAKKLFYTAACRSLKASGLSKESVTHVITVSCTGFFAPGPDYELVKSLGLKASTQRFHIGFMGCYAVFPALKMARAFVAADAEAVVLIASVELCTLHLQNKTDPDNLIAASVFADGGGAAIVSGAPPEGQAALRLEHFYSALVTEGEEDMAWTIGDSGFTMTLSSYVPKLLEANIQDATQPLLEAAAISVADVDHWAIHPGGRAILDKMASGLGLVEEHLGASRAVLGKYGNMSSATILFVLAETLKRTANTQETVYAAAFGPGLTVESALLTNMPKS